MASPPSPPSPPPGSCRPLLLLLLLLLPLLLPPGGAAEAPEEQEEQEVPEERDCGGALRRGKEDFMLDVQDAVKEGAAPVASARVRSADECERLCCADTRCNLALLEPSGADSRTCSLFNCVHRNRFACRFVHEPGFQSYVRESVYRKYLQGPQGTGEKVPPIAIAGRDVIVQPGAPVTLNGTESLALYDARITDYRWTLLTGDGGVRMEATALSDQVKLSNLQEGQYVFKLTVTDSNGQSHTANATVLVLSPLQTTLYCRAEVKVGPCRAAFPRWRYNVTAGVCEQFVYGGCKPNNNNFLSHKECVSACEGVTGPSERSSAPPAGAVCGSECPANQLTCDGGCCLHRSLECDGVPQCSDETDEGACNKLNQTFSRLLSIDVNQQKACCTEPPHTGPCRASLPRWYYNPLDRKCFSFTYGGCNANCNNFLEEDECKAACSGVTEDDVFSRGVFERFEKDDENESGSILLAVVLSVAILSLLAILTYCFLKARRKRSHRPVATGPAHMALSEQDTLVYNSTTKPV